MNARNDNMQIPEIHTPAEKAIVIASVICLFALIVSYAVERPLVMLLEDRWAEFLAYSIIPATVTFTVLYCSGWHREITGVARTGVLLLLSWTILIGVSLAFGIFWCVAAFCWLVITGGFRYHT